MLGRWKHDYLRHDGPEHVLCFAPTRSGKGVGLVVPTLLTWPGSAIVHDIKGENWQLTAGWRARFGRVLLFDPTNAGLAPPTTRCWRSGAATPRCATSRTSPTSWSTRKGRWSGGTTGRRPATRCWSAPSCTCSTPSPTRRSPASPTSSPIRAGRSRRRSPAMMRTPHLGDRPHPVVASAARELLNKSENERSGVLSTAMSFLGLYRDPVVATVTRRCDWRIADLVEDERPATLYLVVPPSDISRTKPLVRLVLNQIGRRLTEKLDAKRRRHRLLLMLDEFPALGRLDFFEVGARLHGRLRPEELPDRPVAQPDREGLRAEPRDPRQLPCARRLRDQRRAHGKARLRRARHGDRAARHEELCRAPAVALARASDGLAAGDGAAAADARRGHAAAADDELVLVSGVPPIRAKKARYFEDRRLKARVLPPPQLSADAGKRKAVSPRGRTDDWSDRLVQPPPAARASLREDGGDDEDPADGGIRREPDASRA